MTMIAVVINIILNIMILNMLYIESKESRRLRHKIEDIEKASIDLINEIYKEIEWRQ